MKLSMMMMISNSMITPMMKHPLSMGMLLMIQTIMMCMNTSMVMKTSWFGYILFITLIGGMMVMFMYMSSIASNEMFKFNKFKMLTSLIMTMMLIMMNKDNSMETLVKLTENKFMLLSNEEIKSTSKFLSKFKSNNTIIIMMILLLTMISVTNISSTFEGPLKKTYV